METIDSFITVKGKSEIELKVKGSKFIGRVFLCQNEREAEDILNALRKKYYDATHHCFAYRTGVGDEIIFRYSDDGEPNGTAGKPIYDRILGKELTDTLLVVTRYYGGTKLGTGGLTHAYSEAAGEAIEKAGVIERYITDNLKMIVQFSDYNNVERTVHQYDGKIIDSEFAEIVRLTVELRLSGIEPCKNQLIELTSGRIKFE